MPKPLETKIAIVTGSGRGIGRAIALRLARERATVVLAVVDAALNAHGAIDIVVNNAGATKARRLF